MTQLMDGIALPWDSIGVGVAASAEASEPPLVWSVTQPYIEPPLPVSSGGGWTLPLLCAGIALIACCILIPLADQNHQLVYRREQMQQDLDQLKRQIATNDEFLKKVADDPALAERLAQRQMKVVRQGTAVLEFRNHAGREQASPFLLMAVPPPPPLAEYKPIGGKLAQLCRNPRGRLYTTGAGLLLIAAGLVLGAKSTSNA